MLRALVFAALLAAGCKGTEPPTASTTNREGSGSGSGTGNAAVTNWSRCDDALAAAAIAPPNARPQLLIDGCEVCGDWDPILRWNTPTGDGGPRREQIAAAMVGCDAFCSGDAKLKFLGTLDDARGSRSRTPWRQLAEICKEAVSAIPDQRFMSAPYFALDRIARAATLRGGKTAALLTALELPLPPVTVVGTSFDLPAVKVQTSSHGSRGDSAAPIGGIHITLLGTLIHVGRLPRARLGANGVQVIEGAGSGYPGRAVTLVELGGALKALIVNDPLRRITLLAPPSTPATRLVDVIAASGAEAVHLGVHADEWFDRWQLPAAIPVALAGTGEPLAIGASMTVQDLARTLADRCNRDRAACDRERIRLTVQ